MCRKQCNINSCHNNITKFFFLFCPKSMLKKFRLSSFYINKLNCHCLVLPLASCWMVGLSDPVIFDPWSRKLACQPAICHLHSKRISCPALIKVWSLIDRIAPPLVTTGCAPPLCIFLSGGCAIIKYLLYN